MENSKIDSFSVQKADNGYTLNYTKKTEKGLGKGTFDNCNYEYKSLVFEDAAGLKEELNELIDSMTVISDAAEEKSEH